MSTEIRGGDALQEILKDIYTHLRLIEHDLEHRGPTESVQSESLAHLHARMNEVSAMLNVLLEEVKLARQQRSHHAPHTLVWTKPPEKDPLLTEAMEAFRNSKGFATVIKWLAAIALGLFALAEGYKRWGMH